MLKIGDFNELEILRKVDFGAYLFDGENERESVLLPRKDLALDSEIGDKLRVFLYFDSEDRLIATTQEPKAKVGDFALLEVIEQTSVGAFLDWGLNKDLLVPFREQPEKMRAGNFYLVKIYYDKVSDRIVGSRRISKFCKGDVRDLKISDKVDVIVWEKVRLGYRVIVNKNYIGIIYFNEAVGDLKAGDQFEGYVHKIREEENRLDIRMRQDGITGVISQKDIILKKLEDNKGKLPINSTSSPEKIKQYFPMSKKTFKQAIGMLYKERKIVITDDGIELV